VRITTKIIKTISNIDIYLTSRNPTIKNTTPIAIKIQRGIPKIDLVNDVVTDEKIVGFV
jgi:hypothetical protein